MHHHQLLDQLIVPVINLQSEATCSTFCVNIQVA